MNAGIHNLDYAEQLYAAFQRDPAAVPAEWRRLFESTADGNGANGRWQPGPSFQPRNVFNAGDAQPISNAADAHLDPLGASLHERLERGTRLPAPVCAVAVCRALEQAPPLRGHGRRVALKRGIQLLGIIEVVDTGIHLPHSFTTSP